MSEAREILEFVKSELTELRKLPRQLTEADASKLVEKYGLKPVKMQLAKMDNWRDIKKNRSVMLTVEKWFEMDIRKGFFKPINPARQPPAASGGNILKQNFLKRYPLGSEIESPTGRQYRVISNEFIEEIGGRSVLPINQVATKEFKILTGTR